MGHWAGTWGWLRVKPWHIQASGGDKGVSHGWAWQQLCVGVSWCCPAEFMWKAGMDLMGVRGNKMSPLFALMGSKLLFELTDGCELYPTECVLLV